MKYIILLTISLLLSSSLVSQHSRRVMHPLSAATNQSHYQENGSLPFPDIAPFFSYFLAWPSGDLEADIRFSENSQDWTAWENLHTDAHSTDIQTTVLAIADARYRYYELRASGSGLAEATLHFFHPGLSTIAVADDHNEEARDLLACTCPQPSFQNRSQWCPNNDCPIRGTPASTTVTHLIVHHTAGPNNLTDWAAYMRAVWDLHYNGRGWDDVGYNWLVDPNGVIYQGRGDNIRGAHFCGRNTGTMGVAMMGDFTDQQPTNEALNALESLLAWKSCDRGLDPTEQALHAASERNLLRVSGHRDGCATSCPGDDFYPLFDGLRTGVVDHIDTECELVSTEDLSVLARVITVAPNPITDQLNLRIELAAATSAYFSLQDVRGKTLRQWQTQVSANGWQQSYDTQDLALGTYWLVIHLDGQRVVKQVVKVSW